MDVTMTTTTSSKTPEEDDYSGGGLWLGINIILAIAIILGNILTLFAILLSKKLRALIANQFVFSLAVSDLLVGFSIPYHMSFYLIDNFGNGKQKCLMRLVLIFFACASSILNLLSIASDRYFAIVYPFHYTRYMTRRTATSISVIAWVFSLSIACIILVWNDWVKGIKCELVKVLTEHFINFIVCPLFALVWIILLFLYSRICREASGHAKRIRSTHSISNGRDSKSFQVMMIILGCFTICWMPFFIVTTYARTTGYSSKPIYEISFNLALANSVINPLIYAWKNTNFRKAFSCLLRCKTPNVYSANFVTNHVPSKKNSLNGICNGKAEDMIRSELDIELRCSNGNGVNVQECSVDTEITSVGLQRH